jgi:hypothetical protein
MAVDVSRIPNNNKFDPVREAILQLQTEIEDTGATIGNGTLTISTSSPLTGSGTFTANQTGPTSISIGIDGAEYLTNITHDTVNQKLVVTYGDGTTADLSLAQYIDDTNLARLVSGSLDNQTGIATFTRDDATTFTVDLSALFDDTDTNDFLTSASFDDSNGIITFGVTNQTSVTVDIDGRYPLVGDLTAVSDNIITSADFSATSNRFKLTLTQEDAGTIEASFDDVVLSESMAADYIPYVKVGGGDGDTTNAVLNDSYLKIDGSTLKLDWGDTVGVYTARDIKMRKDGGGFGKYYEATYAADSVSFLHYESSSDIDTAKIGATTTGRIRINDTYSLPVGDGTSGQVLSTNGSGDLSWVAAGGSLDLQDVTDNGATTTNYITSSADTSNQTYGNFTASGAADWYMFSFGTRSASAGAYGIGLKNDIADRTLSFHIPNHAAYSSTGAIPEFGFYSNGAIELMTIQSNTGNTYVRGALDVGGRTKSDYFLSDENTDISGGTADWLYVGTGSRAGGIIVNDIAGARYGIKAGGYDLTFMKHLSTSDTWSNALRLESTGIDDTADVRVFKDLIVNDNLAIGAGSSNTPDYPLDVNGAGFFLSDSNHSNRPLFLKQNSSSGGNIIQFLQEDNSYSWEIVGRNNGFYIYNNMLANYAMHINESTSNVSIGAEIDKAYKLHIYGSNDYLLNLNNSTTDPRLQFQRSGTAQAHISSGGGLLSLYGESGTNTDIRFMPRGVTTGYINPSGLGIKTTDPEAGVDINIGTADAQADWSSGTLPYGTEKADLVLTRRHSATKDSNLGFSGALIDFRATNTTNEWSTAQIVSTIDPNGGTGHSGGLHFLTSAGGSTDPSGRRNQGGAPAVRMSIDTQGRVGIGRYNPSYKLDVGGTFRVGAATNDITFEADGTHTAIYATNVLRLKQRVEVWGGGSGKHYLDVRDPNGNQNIKLNGEGDSFFSNALAIGATSATAALLISGTGVGAAIDFANTTATTGRNYRLVSLNAGGFALEDQTSATTPFTVSAGGDATFIADVRSQRLLLRSDAIERWEGTGDDKAVTINYFGYNTTFDYFRDLNVFNGKGQYIAKFDGSSRNVGIGYTIPQSTLAVNGTVTFGNGYNGNIAPDRDGSGNPDNNWGLQIQKTANVDDYNTRLNFYPNAGTSRKVGLYDARNNEWILYADGNTNSSPTTIVNFPLQVNNAITTTQVKGISSSLRLGDFTGNNADEWPKLYWLRDTANGWDEGLIKGNSTRGVFGRQHFGIHFDDSRSFGFHTSGWDTEMEIRGDGHIYQKGPVYIGRTARGVAAAHFSVQGSGWYTSDSQSRVLYLDGGSSNGNIVQFQRYGVNKWELVGRDGTFYIYKNDGTGSGYKWQINSSGEHTITGVVTTTSTLRAQGDVIAYYSDMRLKTKIGDIQDPIGKLQSLNGFYYEPNEIAQSYGYEVERRIGLSAQEVKEVVPEAVHDAPIGDGYMAVDYAKLVPVLVEAIKEQQKQIDELKARLDA